MKTEYELILDAITWGRNNPDVRPDALAKEEEKMKICNECPMRGRDKCFSCGVWKWWENQWIWVNKYLDESKNNNINNVLEQIKSLCDGNNSRENDIWHICNNTINRLKPNQEDKP